ncbi:MAG: NifB/NifX family molybdenum-iron cluster-binding protein [Calditrichia bacterium]
MNRRIVVSVDSHPGGKPVLSQHFGGSEGFLVYEVSSNNQILKSEYYANPQPEGHGGGCHLPKHLKQFNPDVVIAGGMGRKAAMKFSDANIQVITAAGGTADEIVSRYLQGEIAGYEECQDHQGDCHH